MTAFPDWARGLRPLRCFAPTPPRVRKPEPLCHVPHRVDANGSTTRAEYPAGEGDGIPIDPLGASEVEGPIDRASPAEIHALGHNWAGTDEGPFRKETCGPRKRGTLNSPSGNPRALARGGCQASSGTISAENGERCYSTAAGRRYSTVVAVPRTAYDTPRISDASHLKLSIEPTLPRLALLLRMRLNHTEETPRIPTIPILLTLARGKYRASPE